MQLQSSIECVYDGYRNHSVGQRRQHKGKRLREVQAQDGGGGQKSSKLERVGEDQAEDSADAEEEEEEEEVVGAGKPPVAPLLEE